MDMKIAGISEQIFREALAQAKEARLHILGEMAKTISVHRPSFKAGVPQIKSFKIAPDKIGALIGPGGKNIKALQENFKVTMDVAEDGTVKVLGVDVQKIDEVIALADMQLNGPKIGAVYKGTVVTIKEYGAFVDIVPGLAGLVHVSEIADERVNDPNDYVSEGQLVDVKVLEVDRFGKIKLSIKAVAPLAKKAK
jgi:polyribonucleotide nucleotidyltransferase